MTESDTSQIDFYELLAVEDNASEKQLQRAFRQQAVKYHPDKNPSADAAGRFHLLSIAIECLTNPEQRLKYDKSRREKQAAQRRRQRIEGERKSWIEELERAEEISGNGETVKKRKREEHSSTENILASEGARLRAELSKNLRAEKTSNLKTNVMSSISCAAQPANTMLSRKTLKVRFRGEQINGNTIRESFARFGHIVDIVYNPKQDITTQSALVEFAEHHGADKAFHTPPCELSSIGFEIRRIDWVHALISKDASKITPEDTLRTPVRAKKSEAEVSISKGRHNVVPSKHHVIYHDHLNTTTQCQNTILEKMRLRQQEKDKEQELAVGK